MAPENDISQLPELRALYECYTAVYRVSSRHTESLGLTAAQFDIIANLGDTEGMTCKALGDATLITKGTLKPVLDRLEDRGLVSRTKGLKDSRQTYVALTPAGQRLFDEVFAPHVAYMRGYFEQLPASRRADLVTLLGELRQVFLTAPALT